MLYFRLGKTRSVEVRSKQIPKKFNTLQWSHRYIVLLLLSKEKSHHCNFCGPLYAMVSAVAMLHRFSGSIIATQGIFTSSFVVSPKRIFNEDFDHQHGTRLFGNFLLYTMWTISVVNDHLLALLVHRNILLICAGIKFVQWMLYIRLHTLMYLGLRLIALHSVNNCSNRNCFGMPSYHGNCFQIQSRFYPLARGCSFISFSALLVELVELLHNLLRCIIAERQRNEP